MSTSKVIWFITGVWVGVCLTLAGVSLSRESAPNPVVAVTDSLPEIELKEEAAMPKFFVRWIDTLTNDTLYYVCWLSPEGDSIPDRVPVIYENGDTLFYNYYLNNDGDTVLLDYTDPSTVLQDSLAVVDSLRTELDEAAKELTDEVARYLDGLGG